MRDHEHEEVRSCEHHLGMVRVIEPTHQALCKICQLAVAGLTTDESHIQLTLHVGRIHPTEYFSLTGYEPTADHLSQQEKIMRASIERRKLAQDLMRRMAMGLPPLPVGDDDMPGFYL